MIQYLEIFSLKSYTFNQFDEKLQWGKIFRNYHTAVPHKTFFREINRNLNSVTDTSYFRENKILDKINYLTNYRDDDFYVKINIFP